MIHRKIAALCKSHSPILWHLVLAVLATVLLPCLLLFFLWRVLRKRESIVHLLQRLCLAQGDMPRNPVVWLHGASVGESLALEWLIRCFLEKDAETHVLLTTTSRASADLWSRKKVDNPLYAQRLHHRMLPFDHPLLMKRFVRLWHPKLLLLSEGDLWPMMQHALRNKGVKRVLLGGRLTRKEWLRWRLFKSLFRWMMHDVSVFLPTAFQATLFQSLGAGQTAIAPSLKWTLHAGDKPSDVVEKNFSADALVLCGASTHAGEEAIVVGAFMALRTKYPNLQLVLVPRDTGRLRKVCNLLKRAKLSWQLWSDSQQLQGQDVLVVNCMGVMDAVHRLSHVVFVGGSLFSGMQGHNIIEAAAHGCIVTHGPFMEKHEEVAKLFVKNKVSSVVDAEHITAILDALLGDTAKLASDSKRNSAFTATQNKKAKAYYKEILNI